MGSTDAPPDGWHHRADAPPPRTDAVLDGPPAVGAVPMTDTEAADVAR